MKNSLQAALRFAWLSAGRKLRKTSVYFVMSAGVTVYSDVVQPIRDAVPVGVLLAAFTAVVAVLTLAALSLRHGPLTEPIAGGGHRLIPGKQLPKPITLSSDVAELAAVSCVLFLLTWAGQVVIARSDSPRGAVAPRDSVSLFATLILQLQGLRSDVAGVRSEVAGVRGDVHAVQKSLENVKKETSEDPRKELANIGTPWSEQKFLEAVKTGDLRVVRLFIDGGMPLASATSQGRPLSVMLALNVTNPVAVLDVLADGGLNINQSYEVHGGLGPIRTTLLSFAIEKGNADLVTGLLRHQVNVNAAVQTFGAFGSARDTYPLASAVLGKQVGIAAALLDNGADPAVGDFAAYREAQAALPRVRGDEARNKLQALMGRLAPSGNAATRIADELRLQSVERELNDVALEGLRAMRGTTQRIALDRRYDELQRERTALQQRLGVAEHQRQ